MDRKMAARKRKSTKSEQNAKAKPAKLGKSKSTGGSSGVPLWQKLLGLAIICVACVSTAVVLGIISIDDIKAIENRFGTSKRTLVEDPVLEDAAESFSERSEENAPDASQAESNKSERKKKDKIKPEVKTEREDHQPQGINKDDTETDSKIREMSPPPEMETESVDELSGPEADEAKTDGTDGLKDEEISLPPNEETENVDEELAPSVDEAITDHTDGKDEETSPPPKEETESVNKGSTLHVDETKTDGADGKGEETSPPPKEETESVDKGSTLNVDETKTDGADGKGEETSPPPKEETESVDKELAPSVDEAITAHTDWKDEETSPSKKIENMDKEVNLTVDEEKVGGADGKDEETSALPKEEIESVDEEVAPSVDGQKTDGTDDKDGETSPPKDKAESVDEKSASLVDETKTDVTNDRTAEQDLRGDLAGSDVQETIKMEKAESVEEKPVKQKKAKEDKRDPLMNASDLKLRKQIQAADKLLQQKKTEQALRKFESLLKQHPESPRVRYGRAQALDKMAEEKRSNEILKSCIDAYGEVALGSDCPDELKKLALRRQAERMSFMGQTRLSAAVLAGLTKDFPSDVQIQKELGVQYLIMGTDAKAKPLFEQVLEIDPQDGFAKVHLGFILKREGLFEDAIMYLREGIESNQEGTSEGKYFFHLGDAYHRTGHPEEANRVYALGAERGLFRSAMQRSLYNVDTLHGQPWWTPKEAKFEAAVQKLESKWQVILEEGLALMNKETQLFESEDESLRDTGDWKQFMLYMRGKKDTKNCAKAPETCKIIDSIPQSAGCKRGQVKFSVMHPGTHVWPHTGPTNCRLRSHLGLVIPEGTRIRVVNETRTWEEGKVLIFDDSFEHEVWQEADRFRLVLIIDLWHPGLTEQQKKYLSPI